MENRKTLKHVALRMAEADLNYDIIPITDPNDIIRYNNPNQKTLFVIDDFVGTRNKVLIK